MEKGTAGITTMIIDVGTTSGMTTIVVMTIDMIVATMIAITVVTVIAMMTDASSVPDR
jgi:hypothetical protein